MIHDLKNFTLTLMVALAGGWLFQLMKMPAPFLLGSLVVTWATGRLIRPAIFRPAIPRWFQITILVCMSVLIGAAFSPSILELASQWAVTVATMVVTTVLATLAGYSYLRRLRRYDHNLAILCSLPGGQAEIVALSAGLVEKDYVVVFCHLVRVTLVFCLTPLILALVKGEQGITESYVALDNLARLANLPAGTLVQFIAIAIAGYGLSRVIRLPMPHLIGPMLLSGSLHIAGWVSIPRISELVILAQITVAGAIGARLSRVNVRELSSYFGDAIVNAILIISIYSIAAFLLAKLGYAGFIQMLLAYIPGGLYEVSLLALIFGYELAFVAFHHSVRFILIFTALPFLIRKSS